MARNDPQLNIRIPQELKTLIEDTAKKYNRSVTQEVIARLQYTFDLNIDINTVITEEELKSMAKEMAHYLRDNPKLARELGFFRD